MELVLEEAAGIPEGSLLSLRIGDSKRRGPASTLGSRFCFAALPVGPVNVKVELLAPAAEPQFSQLDPNGGICSVDFGGGTRVRLRQRETAKPKCRKVDVNRIIDTRNLPAEKLHVAQTAARYLEEHDVVQTFQEILQNLMLSRPDDPFAFIDEHLARARSAHGHERCGGQEEERREEKQCRAEVKTVLEAHKTVQRSEGGSRGQRQEGSTSAEPDTHGAPSSEEQPQQPEQPEGPLHPQVGGRAEQLLQALQADAGKLGEVVAFLPMRVKAPLLTPAFAEECLAAFDSLDSSSCGALPPQALIPMVARLGCSSSMPAEEERLLELLDLLSSDQCSAIKRGEFVSFVHFLLALAYLESEEGKAVADEARLALGRRRVEELLSMLERDRQSAHQVVPLLPPALAEHLASEEFAARSRLRFAELDVNHLGHLRPSDLRPIVVELSMAPPAAVDVDACRRVLAIFSAVSDGAMHEGEFLEFSRFLCIMSFLHSKEGQQLVREALSTTGDSFTVNELLAMLRTDRRTLQQTLQYLPGSLQTELFGEDLDATWLQHFGELDVGSSGHLRHDQLSRMVAECPVAQHLGLDAGQCGRYAALFDDEGSGVLKKVDCPDFVRFLLVLAFLESQDGQKRLHLPASEQRRASLLSDCSSSATPAVDHLGVALCRRKMQTDLDHYRILAHRLELENEMQREHILRMETALHQRGEAHGYHAGVAELNLGAMPVHVG